MEGLIFAAIIMLLGTFFNSKKKDESNETDYPKRGSRSAGQRGQQTFKRIEDYAKEVYGDLQTQVKENPEQQKGFSDRAGKVVERLPDRGQERIKQAAERGRQAGERLTRQQEAYMSKPGGRLSAHHEIGSAIIVPEPENRIADRLELEPENLKKAIILSEILLPPKSKR